MKLKGTAVSRSCGFMLTGVHRAGNQMFFFREFARQLPEDIRTGVVNVILAPTLTWKYDIASIPVTLFFRQGQLVKRAYGPKSISELSRDLMGAKDQQAYH